MALAQPASITNAAEPGDNPPWRAQVLFAVLLFGLVCLTRVPSFFRSVTDWDESLYFLMASAWRAGHLPYTTIWDNKPVGIYVIFAAFQGLFGERIIAIRIAAAVFVTFEAFAVFKIVIALAPPVPGRANSARLAALVFCLCALSNDGLASNAEPFMAAFTAGSVLAALAARRRPLPAGLFTGLLLGAAFMVKYVAVFEAPAVFLLLLWRHRGHYAALAGAACLGGAALPLLVVALLYWHAGQFGLWWDDSIVANLRRLAPAAPPGALAYAYQQQLTRWGPAYAIALSAPVVALWQCRAPFRNIATPVFLSLWLLGGAIGISVAKSFYDHYFLQILPALCVTLGWLLILVAPHLRGVFPRLDLAMLLALILAPPAIAAAQALRALTQPVLGWHHGLPVLRPDGPQALAQALAPALAAGSAAPNPPLYVFDAQPVLYALLHQSPPTRYVLPSELTGQFLSQVANVDATAEVARILALSPRFIVRRQRPGGGSNAEPAVYQEVAATLAARYRLWRQADGMQTYQLIASPAQPALTAPRHGE